MEKVGIMNIIIMFILMFFMSSVSAASTESVCGVECACRSSSLIEGILLFPLSLLEGDCYKGAASQHHDEHGTNLLELVLETGGTLVHALFPGKAPISGDTHFDNEEEWTERSKKGTNLENVAAHELGHGIGLGHSNVRGALMQPFYGGYDPDYKLQYDDICQAQTFYGGRSEPRRTMPRPAPIPRPSPMMTWRPSPTQQPHDDDVCSAKSNDIANGRDGRLYAFRYKQIERNIPRNVRKVFPKTSNNIDAAVCDRIKRKFYIFKGLRLINNTLSRLGRSSTEIADHEGVRYTAKQDSAYKHAHNVLGIYVWTVMVYLICFCLSLRVIVTSVVTIRVIVTSVQHRFTRKGAQKYTNSVIKPSALNRVETMKPPLSHIVEHSPMETTRPPLSPILQHSPMETMKTPLSPILQHAQTNHDHDRCLYTNTNVDYSSNTDTPMYHTVTGRGTTRRDEGVQGQAIPMYSPMETTRLQFSPMWQDTQPNHNRWLYTKTYVDYSSNTDTPMYHTVTGWSTTRRDEVNHEGVRVHVLEDDKSIMDVERASLVNNNASPHTGASLVNNNTSPHAGASLVNTVSSHTGASLVNNNASPHTGASWVNTNVSFHTGDGIFEVVGLFAMHSVWRLAQRAWQQRHDNGSDSSISVQEKENGQLQNKGLRSPIVSRNNSASSIEHSGHDDVLSNGFHNYQ